MKETKELLLFTANFGEASEEIVQSEGQVLLQLTDTVFVALLPAAFNADTLRFSSVDPLKDLDVKSQLFVKAWDKLQASGLDELTGDNIPWDDQKFETPRHPGNDPYLNEADNGLTSVNETMTGKIVVGIVIVSGPASQGLQFSTDDQIKTIMQIMQGTRFLALNAPSTANLSFVFDSNYPTVTALPRPQPCSNQDFQLCEAVFRDPALQQMGYQAGYQGCVDYVNHLLTAPNSNGAYVSFFTKYPLFHFAYQYGVNLYMQYSNDGWGPDRINQVFAHESCHIFGAADEYASSGCTCAPSGKNQTPNNNCENCAYQPKVSCLMNANTLTLCKWSRGQLGWQVAAGVQEIVYGENENGID